MADVNGAAGEKAPTDNASPETPGSADSSEKHSLGKFVEVDGDFFPTFPVKIPVEQHVRNLRQMPMREDDIIIAAFPKCGTHWIWEVTQMLIKGKAEHDVRQKEQVMMEFVEVEKFEPVPSPRVINSHLFLRQLSKEIVTKKPRIIHVIRNPKDVAVSYYFHIIQMNGFDMLEKIGVPGFAKAFLDGGMQPGSFFFDYFAYMKEMKQFEQEHPDLPIIHIYYEDVQQDPVKCVKQLAEFLKVDASDQLMADIATECAFKKLKHIDATVKDQTPIDGPLLKPDVKRLSMYRKGEVGDWKNYFTVALSEEYDRVVPQKLAGLGLNIRYTI